MDKSLLKLIPNHSFKSFVVSTTITDKKLEKAAKQEEENIPENSSGFIYCTKDYVCDEYFKNTIFKFNNENDINILSKLNNLFRQATSFTQFYNSIKDLTKVKNRYWLESEYQTAARIGTTIRDNFRHRNNKDIFPYWKYVSENCEFNSQHNILNNIVLSANDKRWSFINPIKDWNCTCRIKLQLAFEVEMKDLDNSSITVDDYLLKKYN